MVSGVTLKQTYSKTSCSGNILVECMTLWGKPEQGYMQH